MVVWKEISLAAVRSDGSKREVDNEIEILSSLQHPHVIQCVLTLHLCFLFSFRRYFTHFSDDTTLYIEMEYADGRKECLKEAYEISGGTLTDVINRQSALNCLFNEEQVLWYFYQIILALAYLHQRRILHRCARSRLLFLNRDSF